MSGSPRLELPERDDAMRIIGRLIEPRHYREVLAAYDADGLSYSEALRYLGIDAETGRAIPREEPMYFVDGVPSKRREPPQLDRLAARLRAAREASDG